jgi:hypothetical protein
MSETSEPPPLPAFMNPEVLAIQRYWERAIFSYRQASRGDIDAVHRAMFTAFCVHACQSLVEGIKKLIEVGGETGIEVVGLDKLPFTPLIERMRHHDLHGNPIPVCSPGVVFSRATSGMKPMQLTSSHGVGVTVQILGAAPKVRLSRKDQEHGEQLGRFGLRCRFSSQAPATRPSPRD